MIQHGADELRSLADRCSCSEPRAISGWLVDVWTLNEADVVGLADIYRTILLGGADDDDSYVRLLSNY